MEKEPLFGVLTFLNTPLKRFFHFGEIFFANQARMAKFFFCLPMLL